MGDANAQVIDGLDGHVYHADQTSLSVSGAKKLIPPSCPAIFKWERDNGRPNKAVFDFGHAAHAAVLGVGQEVEVIDADDFRSKKAQEAKAEAYAAGRIPLLAKDKERVDGMAAAIRLNPTAARLLEPSSGKAEQSFFWDDPISEVRRRARFDWLPESDGGQLIVPDYKTAPSAEQRAFSNSVATYNYHMQDVWYCDAIRAAGIAEDVTMAFIVQEKTPPYIVSVYELDTEALMIGRDRVTKALLTYRRCMGTDTWPGYAEGIELLPLPIWATYDHDMEADS